MKILSRLSTISDLDFIKDKNEFINLLDFKKYKMASDGKVNVKGNISSEEANRWIKDGYFIIKFGRVTGDFDCSQCDDLKSLEGCPDRVDGSFYCKRCHKLKSLEGCPKQVGKDFNCSECSLLESLENSPDKVGGSFIFELCPRLKTLEGIIFKKCLEN